MAASDLAGINQFARLLPDNRSQTLALSGGGVRGIIPAVIATEISKMVDAPLHQIFDVFAGTSSGGLYTAAILLPKPGSETEAKYSAQESADLFEQNVTQAFQASTAWKIKSLGGVVAPKYDAVNYDSALSGFFGEMTLDTLLRPAYFPAARMPNRESPTYKPYLFSIVSNPNLLIRDVIRATTAAPTYFPAATVKDELFVDGGVYCNNPSMKAALAARNIFGAQVRQTVVSIGTGQVTYPAMMSENQRGLIQWLPNYIGPTSILESVNTLEDVSSLLGEDGAIYPIEFHISNAQSALDDTSTRTMNSLKETAKAWIEENTDNFRAMCLKLKVREETSQPMQMDHA